MIKPLAGISVQGRCFSSVTPFCFFSKEDVRLSLVYGANGSGKSTISKAFHALATAPDSEISVLPQDEHGTIISLSSPPISVFNEEYIDANIKIDDDALGSIVLLGEQVELQSQITAAQLKAEDECKKLESLKEALNPFCDQNNITSPDYHWEQLKNILKTTSAWAKTDSQIKGNRQNTAVTDMVIHEICEMTVSESLEELRINYTEQEELLEHATSPNPAYSSPISALTVDPQIEDRVISLLAVKLEQPILSKREQTILAMVRDGYQTNVEKSYHFFSATDKDFCPYCFQEVTSEYRKELLASIQKVLNKDAEDHKVQLLALKTDDLPQLYDQYRELDEHLVKKLHKLIEEYNQIQSQYRNAVQKKRENLYTPILQNKLGLAVKLESINATLGKLEEKRAAFVQATSSRRPIVQKLLLINKQIAHHFCKSSYAEYQKQLKSKTNAEKRCSQQELLYKQATQHLDELVAKKRNLALAIECINDSLTYVFFSKDRLSIELHDNKYYLKSRGQNVKPRNVSQGERNIIALCYFFIQIAANREMSKRYDQEQLVVIDDPVSSFDFENKIGIISLLRREIKKIIFGNNNSKVLVLTHDLSTMFDVKKAFDEIGDAAKADASVSKASSTWLELSAGSLQQFKNARSEYAQLMDEVYRFAAGDVSLEISIGNKMRRILEAFSTFCYCKSIEDVSCDVQILFQLGEYADYFENRMYRLLLHGESHFKEQIYNFHDSLNFYEYFSVDEKKQTARDILCFMFLLNKQHVKAYLPRAERELNQWCMDIKTSSSVVKQVREGSTANGADDKKKVILYDLPLAAGCGINMFDDKQLGEEIEVGVENCDFALRITGDSMEPKIHDGSIVLIHKQDTIETGEIGAFFHNGHVYCKKRGIKDGKTHLISVNDAYEPIEIKPEDTSKCYGKVIDIIKNNDRN